MWPPAYKRWPSVHLPWGTVCPALSLRLLLLCAAHHRTHFKLPSCRSGIFGMTLADGSVGTTNGSMSAGGQDNDRLGWFYQRAEVKWRWRCRWRCSFARGRRLLVSGLQTRLALTVSHRCVWIHFWLWNEALLDDFMSLIKFYSNAVGVSSYFFLAFSVSVFWLWDGAETLWRSDTNKRTHDSDSESLFCETEIFGVCFSNPQHQSFSSLLARLGGCSPLLVHEAKKMCVALLLLKPNSQPCRLWRETMTCMGRRTHCCPKKTSSVTLSRISSSLLQPSPVQHKYYVV